MNENLRIELSTSASGLLEAEQSDAGQPDSAQSTAKCLVQGLDLDTIFF